MKKPTTKNSTFILISLMIANSLFSQSPLKVDKVIIFTDANAYIQKSGTFQTEDGKYELSGEELPAARFGTLEITDTENSLLNITSSIKLKEIETKPTNVNNALSLLTQNKGIGIELKTNSKEISGELLEVFPEYLIVKTDKIIMVKTTDILSYSFDSEPTFIIPPPEKKETKTQLGMHGTDYNKDVTLTLHFLSDGTKNLNLKFLQKGFSWSPMYTLRLLNEKNANLLLQAEVINDAEDLDNTDIDLVLGTPNFKYDMYLTDLLDYNNILDPFYETKNSRDSRSQYFLNYSIPLINEDQTISGSQKVDDEQQHDFYIHKLHDISLRKNSRGLFKILDTEITYKHIYECDLIKLDYNQNYNNNNKVPRNIVYHSILIENNTDVLFGKGSVLIVDGMQENELPLAQNSLDYIPPNSEGTIKITENPEIEITHKETIIVRSTAKIEFWGRNYYETIIEGSIEVKNLKSESIEVVIRNMIDGELVSTGDNGEIVFQKQPVYSPNYLSKVKWSLNLKPSEEKEVKYQYKVLVK